MFPIIRNTLATIIVTLFLAAPSYAVTILPDPVFPYAVQYDDFYSYSAKILTELGLPGYDVSTGTGGLDLILMTGAGGFPNKNLVGDAFDNLFDGPVDYTNPDTSGTWSSSLDNLVDYMQFAFGPGITIPVFTFDLNQEGSDSNVYATAIVRIMDGDTVVASWSFDNVTDGIYDPTAWIYVPGEITIEYPLGSGTYITVDNNKGSGKMDFLVYAPTMDLMDYYGLGYTFNASFALTGMNNGFDEIYLTGSYALDGTPVPEPSTVAMIGLGLAAFGFFGRRRARA